jgi:hypothetical protein
MKPPKWSLTSELARSSVHWFEVKKSNFGETRSVSLIPHAFSLIPHLQNCSTHEVRPVMFICET